MSTPEQTPLVPPVVNSQTPKLTPIEQQLLQFQVKEFVRDAVEAAVEKEIRRVEERRRDVYRAYGRAYAVVGSVILAFIGITSWLQIPRVVESMLRRPASGQLAQVFQKGQENANRLADQSRIAQQKIDDLSQKILQVEKELQVTRDLSKEVSSQATKSVGLVSSASSTIEKAQKLQAQLDVELKNAKESVAKLQREIAETEKGVIEIEYLQFAGHNMFPNPYNQRIVNRMNSLLAIAIPDASERKTFVQEIQSYTTPNQPK